MKQRKNYTARERRIRSERLLYGFATTLAGIFLIATIANNLGRTPKDAPSAQGTFKGEVIKASVQPQ